VPRKTVRPNKRARVWALIIVLAVFGAVLIIGSLSVVQAECELCVTYRGRTECRRGSGKSDDDAKQAAQRAACAVMAGGMNESIACQNTPPSTARCGLD
jgi:hypothetical protein